MDDQEKLKAAISMLRKLQRMVGFFMKKEIVELISQLEESDLSRPLRETIENDCI